MAETRMPLALPAGNEDGPGVRFLQEILASRGNPESDYSRETLEILGTVAQAMMWDYPYELTIKALAEAFESQRDFERAMRRLRERRAKRPSEWWIDPDFREVGPCGAPLQQ